MLVYATSRNTAPSWNAPDPIHLLYLGPSISDAIEAVGDFTKYRKPRASFPNKFVKIYSALPENVDWKFYDYFAADGYWFSIVEFEVEDVKEKKPEFTYELQEGSTWTVNCSCGWKSATYFSKELAKSVANSHYLNRAHLS